MIRSVVDRLPTHCWPVDKNALREVRTQSPTLFTTWKQPELCPVPVDEVMRRNPSTKFTDMTGFTYGRLTVIGLRQWRAKGNSLWVVQCTCGRYELRTWATLRNMRVSQKPAANTGCHFCAERRTTYTPA